MYLLQVYTLLRPIQENEMQKQANVTVHSVYETYPDEKIDVAAEQKLLEQHDRIV